VIFAKQNEAVETLGLDGEDEPLLVSIQVANHPRIESLNSAGA
jgi:hypothetical protein